MATSPIEAYEAAQGQTLQHYSPSEEEIRKVKFIAAQVDAGTKAQRGFLAQAAEGLAFLVGRQWAQYDLEQGRMIEPTHEEWEARRVDNQIAPAVYTSGATLTRNKPGWSVVPATDDEDDKESARASERLLEHCWHVLKVGGKTHELVMWADVTGLGVLRVWWDPTKGDDYLAQYPAVDEQGNPILEDVPTGETDALGMPVMVQQQAIKERPAKTGYPSLEVCPVSSVVFDPGCKSKDLDDCQWAAQSVHMHIDAVREQWPHHADHVKADTSVTVDAYTSQTNATFRRTAVEPSASSDRVKVVYYFERPSRRHPKGYCAVTACGLIMEETEELPRGKLPFAVIRSHPVPGQLMGLGMVSGAVSPQQTLNGQLSRYIEAVELVANNKWDVQEGALVNEKAALTNEPGEIVLRRQGFDPPRPIPPPPISPEHMKVMELAKQQIRDITGVTEFQQGQVDAQISGRALAMIAELYATKLGPQARELEDAMSVVGSAILEFWRDRMPIEQVIKTLGKDQRWVSYQFKASDITSTDVRVLEGSMTPTHPSVKRELIMEAAGRGIFGDMANPETQAHVRELMEFGNTTELNGTTNAEVQYAREENHEIIAGRPVKAQPYEDHAAHIRVLKQLLFSDKIREAGADAHEAAMVHLAEHEAYKAMAAQGVPWWTQRAKGRIDGQSPAAPAPGPAPMMPEPNAAPDGLPALPAPEPVQTPGVPARDMTAALTSALDGIGAGA